MLPLLAEERRKFLARLKSAICWVKPLTSVSDAKRRGLPPHVEGAVSVADVDSTSSIRIAWEWASRIDGSFAEGKPKDDAGAAFKFAVRDFLETGFKLGAELRPGVWEWKTEYPVLHFDQYQHLHDIRQALDVNRELRSVFSEDYLVKPDVLVYRRPLDADDLGGRATAPVAAYSPLLSDAHFGRKNPLLHASVSCKITMRSDRAQNTRTEALNLLRTRKGRAPAIVAVTAEPLPTRLASLALGTGDVDCVYHAGLYELREAVAASMNEDQADMLETIITGRRIRDISDLVLDLLI